MTIPRPRQDPPVQRPALVRPHEVVDIEHGTRAYLVKVRMDLMHGANFNDPQYFTLPTMERMKVSGHG